MKNIKMSSILYYLRTKYSVLFMALILIYPIYAVLFRLNKRSSKLAVKDRSPLNYNTTVVLLHSETLDSTVWEGINTMEILYNAGYRAIAVDLPGHGDSISYIAPKEDYDRAVIFETLLKELKATEAVVVAPAMSGSYAIPVIVRGSLKLKGFVPISPFTYEKYQKSEYSLLKIPTLIIYGIGDKEYGESSANVLLTIPDSKVHVMKDASHACYIQSPDEFNEILLNFLNEIETGTFYAMRDEMMLKKYSY